MAKGYFFRKGDKTSCGGEVLETDTCIMTFGFAHARAGDPVSCGKNDKTYEIIGGISYMNSHAGCSLARWTATAAVPARPGSTPRLPPPPMSPVRVLRRKPRGVPRSRKPRQLPPTTATIQFHFSAGTHTHAQRRARDSL